MVRHAIVKFGKPFDRLLDQFRDFLGSVIKLVSQFPEVINGIFCNLSDFIFEGVLSIHSGRSEIEIPENQLCDDSNSDRPSKGSEIPKEGIFLDCQDVQN